MKNLSAILIAILTMISSAHASSSCATWVNSSEAVALRAAGEFKVGLGNDYDFQDSCLFLRQANFCIQGDVKSASAYLAALMAHSLTQSVLDFHVENSNADRIVYSITFREKNPAYNPLPKCGEEGDAGGACQEIPSDTPDCAETGTCQVVQSEWNVPITKRAMIPECGYVPAPYHF
jgi:hypothetical protein